MIYSDRKNIIKYATEEMNKYYDYVTHVCTTDEELEYYYDEEPWVVVIYHSNNQKNFIDSIDSTPFQYNNDIGGELFITGSILDEYYKFYDSRDINITLID